MRRPGRSRWCAVQWTQEIVALLRCARRCPKLTRGQIRIDYGAGGCTQQTVDGSPESARVESALPPKADMCGATGHVCFGPTADMRERECIFNRNGMKLRALGPKSNCVVRRCSPNLGESAVAKMRFTVALFVSTLVGVSVPASAEACPDNPDSLATSPVLTINPGELSRIATLQYKQTLELKAHEVVLTFDDGPLPPYTAIILDTLASQCVKATYFL